MTPTQEIEAKAREIAECMQPQRMTVSQIQGKLVEFAAEIHAAATLQADIAATERLTVPMDCGHLLANWQEIEGGEEACLVCRLKVRVIAAATEAATKAESERCAAIAYSYANGEDEDSYSRGWYRAAFIIAKLICTPAEQQEGANE